MYIHLFIYKHENRDEEGWHFQVQAPVPEKPPPDLGLNSEEKMARLWSLFFERISFGIHMYIYMCIYMICEQCSGMMVLKK